MAITAGCLVQNALKKLLQFGSVSNFVGYDAINDFFPRYTLRPNPECDNRHCRQWAVARAGQRADDASASTSATATPQEPVVHEDGDVWGIEVVADPDGGDDQQSTATQPAELAGAGLRHKYDGTKSGAPHAELVVVVGDGDNVDDLAAQLNAL